MIDNSQSKAYTPYKMSVPTTFEVQRYFQVMALVSREAVRKNLSIIRSTVNSTLACMAVPLVQKARDALTKSYPLEPLRVVI